MVIVVGEDGNNNNNTIPEDELCIRAVMTSSLKNQLQGGRVGLLGASNNIIKNGMTIPMQAKTM